MIRRCRVSRRPRARSVASVASAATSLAIIFSNHYQQAYAVYPVRVRLSTTTRRAGALCRLPLDYPPQEDRSNGPALWAPDPRSPAEQPQERLARDPARPAHGRDRRVRLRQVVARLRHALRRRAVALHRVAVHLRAHVPRSGGPSRRGPHRADPARGGPRAEERGANGALDGRHRHRGLRLSAPALREDRARPLPRVRRRRGLELPRNHRQLTSQRAPRRARADHVRSRRARGAPTRGAVDEPQPTRLRSGAGERRDPRPRHTAAREPRGAPDDLGGARPRRPRVRPPHADRRVRRGGAAGGRWAGGGRGARRAHARLRRGLPLQRLRRRPRAAAAAPLFVQPPAGCLPRVQGLRQHFEIRRGARRSRPEQEPRGRRRRALDHPSGQWYQRQLIKAARRPKLDTGTPWERLSGAARALVYEGDASFAGIKGFFEEVESYRYKLHVRVFLSRYRSQSPCPTCHGARLKPAALAVRVGGLTIAEFAALTVDAAARLLANLTLTVWEAVVAREILRQLNAKLGFLLRVGLGYLTLSRQTRTLSGGEAQRINLANQLGSQLVGTLYVLDEPSIGLHPRDTMRLVELCRELARAGNTVVVVEHDREFIAAADHVVELGPGSGERGGEIVFSGPQAEFQTARRSLTARYVTGRESIPIPPVRRAGRRHLVLVGAREHNLKDVTVRIPLHTLTVVSGVSGSGKSTLVHDTLYRAVARAFKTEFAPPGAADALPALA